MKKSTLCIVHVLHQDKVVGPFTDGRGKVFGPYTLKKGEVVFAVSFEGYITKNFFYGIRTSVADGTDSSPRYIRVACSKCRHYAGNALDLELELDADDNYANHPDVQILTTPKGLEVEAFVNTL